MCVLTGLLSILCVFEGTRSNCFPSMITLMSDICVMVCWVVMVLTMCLRAMESIHTYIHRVALALTTMDVILRDAAPVALLPVGGPIHHCLAAEGIGVGRRLR